MEIEGPWITYCNTHVRGPLVNRLELCNRSKSIIVTIVWIWTTDPIKKGIGIALEKVASLKVQDDSGKSACHGRFSSNSATAAPDNWNPRALYWVAPPHLSIYLSEAISGIHHKRLLVKPLLKDAGRSWKVKCAVTRLGNEEAQWVKNRILLECSAWKVKTRGCFSQQIQSAGEDWPLTTSLVLMSLLTLIVPLINSFIHSWLHWAVQLKGGSKR